MLDQEPFRYPSRQRFVYDPGIPDKQLWAIGMVVVQWSMTEFFIDMSTHHVIANDQALLEEYKKIRNFQQSVAFYRDSIEAKSIDPFKAHILLIIPRIQALSAQRDEVVHRMWGGGMEGTSRSAAGFPTTEAGMMQNPGEKLATKAGGMIPFAWKATFVRLKKLAADIADLNRDLLTSLMVPGAPHGHVDADD